MNNIVDHASLINSLGGNKAVADWLTSKATLSVKPVTVGQWKLNNRIPPEYWLGIIDMTISKSVLASGEVISTDWLTRTIRHRKLMEPAA